MLRRLSYASMLTVALVSSGALAQSTNDTGNPVKPPAQDQASKTSEPAAQSGTESPSGEMFVKEQAKTQWRAAKLVGVAVYGADNQKIGKITDVMMSHDGAAQVIVIGVGGFLGFGAKEVGVPFTALQWQTEPRKIPATDQPPANPIGATGGGGSPTASQTTSQPPMKQIDPAATEASQGYPDKAILKVTLAELKSAPDFKYAPSPLAETESGSPAGGKPAQSQSQ